MNYSESTDLRTKKPSGWCQEQLGTFLEVGSLPLPPSPVFSERWVVVVVVVVVTVLVVASSSSLYCDGPLFIVMVGGVLLGGGGEERTGNWTQEKGSPTISTNDAEVEAVGDNLSYMEGRKEGRRKVEVYKAAME